MNHSVYDIEMKNDKIKTFTRKVSYDITKKLGFTNFSSNLIKYILDFFPINEYLEIKNICKNLHKIIHNMNMFKEYMELIKKIKVYPKNIPEALFKDNGSYVTSCLKFELFLKEEEKIKVIQNFLHFLLRKKKMMYLPDVLRIGENGIYYLSQYLNFHECEIHLLNLNYNYINDESAANLSKAIKNNRSIRYLHLNGVNLSPDSCDILGEGLSNNDHIQKLEMSFNNNLRLEAVKLLFSKLVLNKSIQTIFFTDNLLRKDGSKVIGEFLKDNPPLRELYIEKNEIGDEGLSFIASSLTKNKNLQIINLSDNSITSLGLKTLAQALNQTSSEKNYNTSIKKLFLKANILNTKEGGRVLADILFYNRSITHLDLSSNNLTEAYIGPLSESLKVNTTLQNLILESNNLAGSGSNLICEGLKKNRGLKFLNLRNNSLGLEGAKHIAELLTCNRTLQNINLQSNLLDEHAITLIADKVGYNTELKIINLAFNQLPNIHEMINNLTLAKDVIIY